MTLKEVSRAIYLFCRFYLWFKEGTIKQKWFAACIEVCDPIEQWVMPQKVRNPFIKKHKVYSTIGHRVVASHRSARRAYEAR